MPATTSKPTKTDWPGSTFTRLHSWFQFMICDGEMWWRAAGMLLSCCLCWCRFLLSVSPTPGPHNRQISGEWQTWQVFPSLPTEYYFHENLILIPVCFSIRLPPPDVGQARRVAAIEINCFWKTKSQSISLQGLRAYLRVSRRYILDCSPPRVRGQGYLMLYKCPAAPAGPVLSYDDIFLMKPWLLTRPTHSQQFVTICLGLSPQSLAAGSPPSQSAVSPPQILLQHLILRLNLPLVTPGMCWCRCGRCGACLQVFIDHLVYGRWERATDTASKQQIAS